MIQCSDPELQAAMASIKTDNGLEGMRNNFEATAAHLLPSDPVAKKRSGGQKRGSAQISSVMDPSPATKKKPSIGKTGVHLCLAENVAKDTSKGSLFDCPENVSHYTYYCLNNQCEY